MKSAMSLGMTLLACVVMLACACQIKEDGGPPIAPEASVDPETALWQALASPGHLGVMRHGLAGAPASGRPHDVHDPSTQGRLTQAGEAQARMVGERLRQHGIVDAQVYSSRYCRAATTARLLEVGSVTIVDALNVLEGDGRHQTEAVHRLVAGADIHRPLLLVSHQPNIAALTGRIAQTAEIVVLRRDGDAMQVIGTLVTPVSADGTGAW